MLGRPVGKVYDLIRREELANLVPRERRNQRVRVYLDPDEVTAFALGGVPAAKKVRERRAQTLKKLTGS